MSITTNKLLNKIVIEIGKIEQALIKLLYFYYRKNPPKNVICSRKFFERHAEDIKEIKRYLADERSKEIYEKLIKFRSTYDMRIHPEWSLEDIYFVKGIISLSTEEIFIDCGAFDGDSIEKFINKQKEFKSIVAFEPDVLNYKLLCEKFIGDRFVLRNTGVWNENTKLIFQQECSEISKISQEMDANLIEILVESLDQVEECANASYIKMDIEGSEIEALKGAEEIIKRNKPKLAISIYHKDEHMIEIPRLIKELVPEYKMYVRQHSHTFFDTVLYCTIEE